jgi:hypothetical protein
MDVTESPPAERSGGRLAGWLAVVGALTALNYGARLAVGTPEERDILYEWSTVVASLFQFGILLGLTLLIVRGAPRDLLALRRPRDWRKALGMMLLVFVATFVVAGLVSALGVDPGAEQGLTPDRWRPERAAQFAGNFAVVAGFVPVVEELLFRGAGFSLLARFGPWTSIVALGLIFGVAHGLVLALPILVAFGIGLAWLRERTGSVYPCIALHGTFNAVSLIASVTVAR